MTGVAACVQLLIDEREAVYFEYYFCARADH
jgi:hypothetical protein